MSSARIVRALPTGLITGVVIGLVAAGLAAGAVPPGRAAWAQPAVDQLTREIDTLASELERVVESYNRLNEERKRSEATARRLAAQLDELEQRLAQAEDDLGVMASAAYKGGELAAASALLSGADARESLISRLGMLDQLARDRRALIADYTAARQQYEADQKQLAAVRDRQDAQARALAARKKKIETELSRLYALRRAAYGRATAPGRPHTGAVPAVSGAAGVAVRYAYAAIGKPYLWAGDGPHGYDCSGLTLAAWRAAGVSLPHNAAMQWSATARISRGELSPGDLVFYRGLTHVALYVGDGKVIHAPTFGQPVTLANVDVMPPVGYGRVRVR